MRDSSEVIEDIVALCEMYENRERLPFIGIAQLFDDQVAHLLFTINLRTLTEEFSRSMIVEELSS